MAGTRSPTTTKTALDRDGFVGPFALAEPERVRRVLDVHPTFDSQRNQHVARPEVAALMQDPGLIATVQALCGPDLLLWRSAFFAKSDGAAEIGWHHDKHFQVGEEPVDFDEIEDHFSVLIALSAINQHTGQIEVLPGTHLSDDSYARDTRPYHQRPGEDHFPTNIPERLIASRVGLDIPSAHFIVFHSAIWHRSLSHAGGPPRLGLAIRFVRRGVTIPPGLALPSDVVPFGRSALVGAY